MIGAVVGVALLILVIMLIYWGIAAAWAILIIISSLVLRLVDTSLHIGGNLHPVAVWALAGAALGLIMSAPIAFRVFHRRQVQVALCCIPLLLLVLLRVIPGAALTVSEDSLLAYDAKSHGLRYAKEKPPTAVPVTPRRAVVIVSAANMRAQPRNGSKIVKVVKKGEVLSLRGGNQGGWVAVRTTRAPVLAGYIWGKLITAYFGAS